jgi:predicted RNase H-like HicB family nuclease
MPAYIALLRKEPTSDFGVDFPDFPGCVTAGKTLEEGRHMAAEALELHVRGMREDGDPIPFPSTLDAIMDDHANRDAVAFLVDVAARPAPSVRINIMLPHDLVAAIDRVTTNRSRFLAEAARANLREREREAGKPSR